MGMEFNLLTQSVERFASRMAGTYDVGLEAPWSWQSYDSEGVRFAFCRTYEDLRELAARLVKQRMESGSPQSEAQYILAQYHAAYRDMQAAVLGLTEAQMLAAPDENNWPLHTIIAHMMQADIGFNVVVSYALEGIRAHAARAADTIFEAQDITDEAWERIAGLDDAAEKALMDGPLEPVNARMAETHARVLKEHALISAAELDQPSRYWEAEPYSLRYRLHRFDSHMRQHTIQIDKTRAALGLLPTESQRLLRLIYAALAEVEGALIGFDQALPPEIAETARAIDARLAEISA